MLCRSPSSCKVRATWQRTESPECNHSWTPSHKQYQLSALWARPFGSSHHPSVLAPTQNFPIQKYLQHLYCILISIGYTPWPASNNSGHHNKHLCYAPWAFLVAQTVKNLPAMRETRVQSLGQEDPLEKKMVTHSSILAWRIPWTEELGGLQSMGLQRVGQSWVTNTFTFLL